jgi:hypothetical protein
MPVYWRPKYGTRSSRHRAWVEKQARREAALAANRGRGPSFWRRFIRGLRGNL